MYDNALFKIAVWLIENKNIAVTNSKIQNFQKERKQFRQHMTKSNDVTQIQNSARTY